MQESMRVHAHVEAERCTRRDQAPTAKHAIFHQYSELSGHLDPLSIVIPCNITIIDLTVISIAISLLPLQIRLLTETQSENIIHHQNLQTTKLC